MLLVDDGELLILFKSYTSDNVIQGSANRLAGFMRPVLSRRNAYQFDDRYDCGA